MAKRLPPIFRECPQCKETFKVLKRRPNQKFCSHPCYSNSLPKPLRYSHCQHCNVELTKPTQIKFCGHGCAADFNNTNRSYESRLTQQDTLRKTLTDRGIIRTDKKEIYYNYCQFGNWRIEIWRSLPGFDLLKQHGMWHPINNPSGVVRDHIFSKFEGWVNRIDPRIVSHPANCRLIPNLENVKKHTRCDISLHQLTENIQSYKFNVSPKIVPEDYISLWD